MTKTAKRALVAFILLSLPFTANFRSNTDTFVPPKSVYTPTQIASFIPYPHQAITYGIEGRVLIRFKVTKTGSIERLHVLSKTHDIFENAVLSGVKYLYFTPAKDAAGNAIEMWYTLPITFKLNKK